MRGMIILYVDSWVEEESPKPRKKKKKKRRRKDKYSHGRVFVKIDTSIAMCKRRS
jgi:hypothetical protein